MALEHLYMLTRSLTSASTKMVISMGMQGLSLATETSSEAIFTEVGCKALEFTKKKRSSSGSLRTSRTTQ